MRKADRNRDSFAAKTALIIPCKGIDTEFEKNIASFYTLDYNNYEIIFVTESQHDPAYKKLLEIREKYKGKTKAFKVSIVAAGIAAKGGQKIHNQLFGCRIAENDTEVYAFADSDACVRYNWMNELLYPLRKGRHGISSGYRWYVPLKNNFATIALSVINAKVAQLLGATAFNHAWGGSMAVRVETFKKLQMEKIWENSVSDDLTLSRAAKKAGLKVFFVPACFVASYEEFDMPRFFEFVRRQFILTRVTTPGVWLFGLTACLYSVFALWGFLVIALYLRHTGAQNWQIFLLMACLSLSGQIFTASLRQNMISEIFPADWPRLKMTAIADIFAAPVWSFLMLVCILSSSFGRTIQWRGVRYKLTGPTTAERI